MKVGIPKEIAPNETRVAVVPQMINIITKMEHEVLVEKDAGNLSGFSDDDYSKNGAKITDAASLYKDSDVILKIQSPIDHPALNKHESESLRDGAHLITFLSPATNPQGIKKLQGKKVTAFDMGFVPRITRAQSMDALSSMATVAGYKAVIMGADYLGKMFPLMMTAAGTIAPSNVLVLGAGVAGLQAIATAKRLGAKVEAFDPRAAVKEQIESLGAKFVKMELPEEDAETEGGYAKEMSDEFLKKEQEAITSRLAKVDLVVSTAQVFGKKAPILVTEEMIKMMHPGSVIIDIAADQGGNTALTQKGKVEKHGIIIHGDSNLSALIPVHASQMYSKNITNLFKHIYQEEIDWEDEITKGACVVKDGKVVNDLVAGMI